jgi:hypothetical protein
LAQMERFLPVPWLRWSGPDCRGITTHNSHVTRRGACNIRYVLGSCDSKFQTHP